MSAMLAPMNRIVGVLGALVGLIGLSSVVYPPLFGAILGFAMAHTWDGTSTLNCGGNQRMTIEGKHASATAEELGAFEHLISVGGNCELTLINCDFEAPTVIDAGGSAKVVIIGGHMNGSKHAIDAGGNATVEVRDAHIEGAVSSGGSAKLIGIAAQAGNGRITGVGPDAWMEHACEGVSECFTRNNYVGNVALTVTTQIKADGHAGDVAMEGEVAPMVRACITDSGHAKRIEHFDGKPGALTCKLAGTVNAGTQMLSIQQSFERAAHPRD
jgi:hypothetical protein